jgi:hypothetical protein
MLKRARRRRNVGQGSGQWKVKEGYYGGQLIDHLWQWLCYVSDLFRKTVPLFEMGVGLSKAWAF